MSTALKCPNPSCSYLFDPSTVPTGVMLACPRCGMRFTLGTPAAAPPTDPHATATFPGTTPGMLPGQPGTPNQPVPPGYSGIPGYSGTPPGYPGAPPGYPGAPPSYPGAPPAPANRPGAAFGELAQGTARAEGEETPQSPVRASRLQMIVLAGVTAIAITAAAIAVWYKLTQTETLSPDLASRFKEVNLEFEPPPSPWARDEDMRVKLGSPYILVYKRDNPEAYMAFGAKDYDPSSPRESDLRDGLKLAVEKIVDKDTLKLDEDYMSGQTWMGKEVKGFRFHAQLKDGTAVDGEACRFSYKGIGYWFLAWTGENNIFDEMQPSFAEARRHCKLLAIRNDWVEKQSSTVRFTGERTNYTILDAEGIWEEDKDESRLQHEGEGADKILKVKRGKRLDEVPDATLIVYVLNSAGDPLSVGRDKVVEKRKSEIKLGGDYQVDIVEVDSTPEGNSIKSPVDNPLPVKRFKSIVKGAASQSRFHVVSAARIDDKIVVVHAYSSLGRKADVEAAFIQIASSLH